MDKEGNVKNRAYKGQQIRNWKQSLGTPLSLAQTGDITESSNDLWKYFHKVDENTTKTKREWRNMMGSRKGWKNTTKLTNTCITEIPE